jgi:hypothetical protein
MQTLIVLNYHVSLTTACYQYLQKDSDQDPYTHQESFKDLIKDILYYKLIPFQLAITLALGAIM